MSFVSYFLPLRVKRNYQNYPGSNPGNFQQLEKNERKMVSDASLLPSKNNSPLLLPSIFVSRFVVLDLKYPETTDNL